MAISIRGNAGAWAASTATTQTVTLPTHATGDMLIVRAACKPYTATITCSTTGWNPVGDQYANGTTDTGNGTGSLAFRAFYKIATSASETNPVIAWGTTVNPGQACAVVYQKGATEEWVTPTGAGGGDATARTSQTCTISSHISVVAGDMVDFYLAWCDNYDATSPTITQTGVTYGTVAEQPATAGIFSDGFDGASDGGYRLASAGPSSAAAVVTATFGNSEQGGAWQTRLRVQTATSATAGVATATTAAANDTAKVAAGGTGAGAATGAALAATGRPGTRASTTLATATGAAAAGTKKIGAVAGAAAGTGAALAATGRPGEYATTTVAEATGAALDATGRPGEYATTTLAEATVAALDGTVETSALITFDADCATATAAAIVAHMNLSASAGHARARTA